MRGSQRYHCKDCRIYFTLRAAKQKQQTATAVTVKDIAKALNVSVSTVSRALHGNTEISEKTRNLVLQKAQEMDYMPNQLAYALSTNKSNRIGIIVPEINYHFFPAVINAASDVFRKAGYQVLIANTNNEYELEVNNARNFLSEKVAGLLVSLASATSQLDHFAAFAKRNIPVVFFNRVPGELDVPKVSVNDYAAAVQMVTHLLEQGYTNIAHVQGPPNLLISKERLRGYKDALKQKGIAFNAKLVVPYHTNKTLFKKRILGLFATRQKPDAVFCFNDPAALEIIMLAKELNMAIPQELGVAGFSDEPAGAYIQPSLTTVHHPLEEMGKLSAKLLLQQIAGKTATPDENTVLDAAVVVRNSTCKNS